jgi:hypothetical protein
MSLQPLESRRFVRKTRLAPNEYRKNFQQIDRDILSAISSAEADQVTPLMSKIYLRLVNAPEKYWEREGVLRIEAEVREEKLVKAWAVLCDLAGVASATASKAVRWMHEQGIIGYFAGKNGAGIRVFLNRAASSIGTRGGQGREKILDFSRGSSAGHRGSQNEPAFNDPSGVSESLDTDINPHAPKNGADKDEVVKKASAQPPPPSEAGRLEPRTTTGSPAHAERRTFDPVPVDEIVSRLRRELEPELLTAARQAAAREHERTREWLESRGLPKAARVAQREAYNVLRQHGVIGAANERARAELGMGRQGQNTPAAKALTPDEVREVAESCVAMLEAHGRAIDVTLAEISAEAGGFLLPVDAPKVRELAEAIARGGGGRE